jgi:2,4-dienoyl-CoA reductase (NADPH2)
MISVTVGWQESPESSIGRDIAPGHWNHLAARAKDLLPDIPIAFGQRLPNPVDADRCISDGAFDYWEVCRPLLADPELIRKAREDRLEERKVCIGSLNCLSRLFRDLPYTCTVNPALGHEDEPSHMVTPAANPKKIMVIGAGPAGLECAITAAQRGHDVTLFERGTKIGGALNGFAGHDLANRDDLRQLLHYYHVHVEKLGIDLRLETEVSPKFMRDILHQYDAAIVAAGARIDPPRPVELANGRVIDAMDVALGTCEPHGKIVVLGAGKIGLTLAEDLKSRGASVSIVESSKRIGHDVSPTWKWRHSSWIDELDIEVLTEAQVIEIGDAGLQVLDRKGNKKFVAADTIIVAEKQVANQELFHDLQWMVDELHICGDAVSPRGLDQAISEGYGLGCRI